MEQKNLPASLLSAEGHPIGLYATGSVSGLSNKDPARRLNAGRIWGGSCPRRTENSANEEQPRGRGGQTNFFSKIFFLSTTDYWIIVLPRFGPLFVGFRCCMCFIRFFIRLILLPHTLVSHTLGFGEGRTLLTPTPLQPRAAPPWPHHSQSVFDGTNTTPLTTASILNQSSN